MTRSAHVQRSLAASGDPLADVPAELLKPIKPRHLAFLRNYAALNFGDGAEAARRAGYSDASNGAKSRAWRILSLPPVAAVVAHMKRAVAVAAKYDAEAATREIDAAIEFARQTKNANAYVKAVELRMKLTGLLDDKPSAPAAALQININGLQLPPGADVSVIDVSDNT